MKLGVYIPGRLASERLPNKLILPLGESNLWEIACKKLNALPEKYNKYVLCYDEELVRIAERYPNIQVIIRSKETSEVDGPLSFIFKEMKEVPDTHLMFLNPCLSFLQLDTIINSLEYFRRLELDYATSVRPLKNWLFDKRGESLNEIDYMGLSTKSIDPIYQAAHCFHIFNKDQFFKDGMMLKPNHGIIHINNEVELIDIDTYEDYEFAKWKHSKKYVIDIDGTICETMGTDYENATPIKDKIDRFNRLYDAGNTIWYETARGYVTGIDHTELTTKQLKDWGVKYHKLIVGKKSDADVYIDDKASNVREW